MTLGESAGHRTCGASMRCQDNYFFLAFGVAGIYKPVEYLDIGHFCHVERGAYGRFGVIEMF
jgi:hypothetical protein